MIPARRNHDSTPAKESLDFTARLQRLRYEQRNHPLQLPPRQTAASTFSLQPNNLHPAFALLSLDHPPPPQPTPSSPSSSISRYRGTAGPSAPASWLSAERESADQVADRRREARKRALVPLEEGDGWLIPRSRRVPSLGEFCGRAVALDLARGKRASLLLEHVRWLPARMRLPMLELGPVKNGVGLGQAAIRELSMEECEEGEQEWDEPLVEVGDEVAAPTPPDRDRQGDLDWESEPISAHLATPTISATLTHLNLSLCTLTPATLASLLLASPASLSASASGSPRPTPTFPHLTTLNLTGSPNLTLSDPLLDLLTPLLSLRHLSLACLPLADPLTPSTALPRLAAATPTLESVDLSFVDGLSAAVLRNVNWDVRWRELRVVGWRRWMFVVEGGKAREASRGRKDEVARELWGVVRGARREKGRFIKFVT